MKNVIPIKNEKVKPDKYPVYIGEVDEGNQVVEKAKIGVAFMKPGSKSLRLKLWMFEAAKLFIIPVEDDRVSYNLYSIEEFKVANGETNTYWNHVGKGIYFGNYLKLDFHLFPKSLFVSLFPTKTSEPASSEGEAA